MKSFLLNKDNKPICKWGLIPPNTYFTGKIPDGFSLAICPSENIIILDVDVKNGKNGFNHIPSDIYFELRETFNYKTKSGGGHYFIKYTGNKTLINKSTKYGLDLRIGAKKDNCGGYVKYNHTVDVRDCLESIKETSYIMNKWLETLFSYIN